MATKKEDVKAPKKKPHIAGEILDLVGWGVREAALPVPDTVLDALKKKKKGKK